MIKNELREGTVLSCPLFVYDKRLDKTGFWAESQPSSFIDAEFKYDSDLNYCLQIGFPK